MGKKSDVLVTLARMPSARIQRLASRLGVAFTHPNALWSEPKGERRKRATREQISAAIEQSGYPFEIAVFHELAEAEMEPVHRRPVVVDGEDKPVEVDVLGSVHRNCIADHKVTRVAVCTAIEAKRSRGLFRELIDVVPVASLVLDRFGIVVAANRAACELLQLHEEECIGEPLLSWIGRSGDREAFGRAFMNVREHADVTTFALDLTMLPVLAILVFVGTSMMQRGEDE